MNVLITIFLSFLHIRIVNGFSFYPRTSHWLTNKRKGSSSSSGSSIPPISPPNDNYYDDGDGDDGNNNLLYSGLLMKSLLDQDLDEVEQNIPIQNESIHQNDNDNNDESIFIPRGGSSTSSSDDIVAGTKSTLQSTGNYWISFFRNTQSKIKLTIQNLNPLKKKSTNEDEDDDNEPDVSTIPVQNIKAPGSTILPDAIIRSAGQRSGLIGSVMRSDKVQECAKIVKSWYIKRGYVLHTITGATLHAENGTATLNVQEPKSADLPLDIRFAKLVPIDPDTGEITTMRKYKTKLEKRKGRLFKGDEWTKIKSQLNTTLIEAKGRTNPRTISKRLGLKSGHHFKWDGHLWQRIAQSGIFTKVWKAQPVRMSDGSVQVQVLAQESPSKNLEYGIQKSLYTGNWVSKTMKHDEDL